MRNLIILIISFLIVTSSACAQGLKFVQVTDVHLAPSGSASSRNIDDSVSGLQKTIESINTIPDLDFVVFSGDNIDQSNEESLKTFCQITQKLNKPYYIILGNHDAYAMGGISKTEYINIVKKYNKYQQSSSPFYYIYPNKEFIVIMMDGAISSFPNSHGFYYDEELEWLNNTLQKNSKREAVIIQHFPLVEPVVKKSHRVIDPENYFDVLKQNTNIFGIFSGHYHAEGVNQLDGIYHVSTPSLLDYPYKYRVVEIKFNDNTQKYELNTELIPTIKQ